MTMSPVPQYNTGRGVVEECKLPSAHEQSLKRGSGFKSMYTDTARRSVQCTNDV